VANHPHICTLFDVGHEGESHFLVMELLEGESLADRLQVKSRTSLIAAILSTQPPPISRTSGPSLHLRVCRELRQSLDAVDTEAQGTL